MRFVVVAHVQARLGHQDHMAAEINALAEASLLEEGCEVYKVCQEVDCDLTWLIYEVWQSEAHFRAHLKADALQKFKAMLTPEIGTLHADKLVFAS